MVNRNLIRSLENDPELNAQFQAEIEPVHDADSLLTTIESETNFDVNTIVEGRILRVDEETVLVDVGFKSEGSDPAQRVGRERGSAASRPGRSRC